MRAWKPLILLALPMSAVGEVPLEPYPDCGTPDDASACPSDLDGRWNYLSYVPEHTRDTVLPDLLDFGAGHSADLAWATTVGQWDAVIAVADSGIDWSQGDLVNKAFLNTGELPLPQDEDGNEAASHDLDGNGIVNVEDYASDPRVDMSAGRDRADDMLDPSDLIYTFSDDVDDDGNGFVDDISGWDFFNRDNDPHHEIWGAYGDHGTGVAREAAAEGENGGRVGVCPNCAVLPLRVGDTFVTDGARAGEAMVYATDMNAVVMSMAIGAVSNPAETTAAARYAFEQGTTLVGAAGDENSYHHNFPAVLDDVIYTHSIKHNTASEDGEVESYFNTWNCNNYGMRLHTVSPSHACATGAVASTAGIVGLLHSAAWDVGDELHAGEVLQLLQVTADDIALSEADIAESKSYPSKPGWDGFHGYGRVNAAAAVDAIVAGEIPPWVSLSSPGWFEVVSTSAMDQVELVGTISGLRSDSWSAEFFVGTGFDPDEWSSFHSATGSGEEVGTLATLSIADFDLPLPGEPEPTEGILDRLERVNGPAVTVRVDVTDADGRVGTFRKTFFVTPDDDAVPGFPIQLGSSAESSPMLADLTGDGIYEVILATTDGHVHAYDGAGSPVEGWPVRTELLETTHLEGPAFASGAVPAYHDGLLATVAVGDLDDDGSNEVIGAGIGGGLYAWHSDGTVVDGFPTWAIGRTPDEFGENFGYDQGFMGAPSLADLDDDGTLEIVIASSDSRLYVVDHTGADWGPYPIEICHPELCGDYGQRTINSVVIGDADGDGDLDFAFGSNEALDDKYSIAYLFDATTGELHPGWPLEAAGLVNEAVLLPLIGEGHPASMAAADLDGDGDLEYSNPIMLGTTDLVHHDQEVALEIPTYYQDYSDGHNAEDVPASVQFVSQPAFGDIDLDGVPDYVLGGASTLYLATLAVSHHMDFQNAIGAWSGVDGTYFPGWPRQIEDAQFLLAPAIADVSGDGWPEVMHGSAGYLLHAWDKDGVAPEGWPKFTGGWQLGSPAVGDIDGDGYVEVVVSTREGGLFAWKTAGRADQELQWASMHHDTHNTSNWQTPLPTQAGPDEVAPAGELQGCTGCARGTAALFLLLPLAGLRRRR